MTSHLTFSMANLALLPGVLGSVLSERRKSWIAIVATTAVAIALTLTGTAATLAEFDVLLLLFVFLSSNVAVLVLRRDSIAEVHFRVPTWRPVLALVFCLILVSQQGLGTWLRAAALVLARVLLYGCTRFTSRQTVTSV